MKSHHLVLDIGTTQVKAFVFDLKHNIIAKDYYHLKKFFPQKGYVEQDPEEIISASRKVLKGAVRKSRLSQNSFSGLGLANQRETTILWDKKTWKSVYPAIVWEDTRTQKICDNLPPKLKKEITWKTGLSADPYFSATKIQWLLQNIPKTKSLLREHRLAFGTPDSWFLFRSAEKNPHLTDYTNASRTLIFNIRNLKWDRELLDIFKIPEEILPEPKASAFSFGTLKKEILGFSLPILGIMGDQEASMYAAGASLGRTKITFGTGTFIMQIIGAKPILKKPFFTTLVPGPKKPLYALEAKIDCCGKKVEPLLKKPKALDNLLKKLALEVNSYLKKLPLKPKVIFIDGGVSQAKNLVSIQSAVSKIPIHKQKIFDATALGVSLLISKN